MGLSYQQIYLEPEYSGYPSRSDISTSVKYGPNLFKIPALPANMKCTIDESLAKWMSQEDYFYIMHRFGKSPADTAQEKLDHTYQFVKTANEEGWKTISISIGVQEGDLNLYNRLMVDDLRVDYVCIDIAHAHSVRMRDMLRSISTMGAYGRCKKWRKPFIIAGNAATPRAVLDIELWGADSVKVGIAQGGACTTFGQTGFGVPMFTCMLACSEVAKKPLIADGGIKTHGDFAKAFRAGGDMIMAGSFFASSADSPAESVVKYFDTGEVRPKTDINGNVVSSTYENRIIKKVYKKYYGSASSYNKHSDNHIEGTLVELECDGTSYSKKLKHIEEHLQSSISYAGGDLLSAEWGVIGEK